MNANAKENTKTSGEKVNLFKKCFKELTDGWQEEAESCVSFLGKSSWQL